MAIRMKTWTSVHRVVALAAHIQLQLPPNIVNGQVYHRYSADRLVVWKG
jgi:hypothetical protein